MAPGADIWGLMPQCLQYKVLETDSGLRLDRLLAQRQLCTSRSVAARWLEEGRVHLNHQLEKPATIVKAGDVIEINPPVLKISELVPKEVEFTVLHEDRDILVLNKPAGLVVHPGAGHHDESLVHGLLHRVKGLSGIGGVERPGIVHRLDKGTSGVMVVAKNDRAHAALTRQFQERLVKKEYLALVVGSVSKDDQRLEHLMKRSELNRKKFVVNQKKGKTAVTRVQLIRRAQSASFMRALPETGRTHQIRVHLSFIGHPILGDETYGCTRRKLAGLKAGDRDFILALLRPLLHAHRLSFMHPATKKNMEFCVNMPKDMQDALVHFWPDMKDYDEG